MADEAARGALEEAGYIYRELQKHSSCAHVFGVPPPEAPALRLGCGDGSAALPGPLSCVRRSWPRGRGDGAAAAVLVRRR